MNKTLLWFRRDLRLTDNPALQSALRASDELIPVYIHNPEEEGLWPIASASRWWLHHSLSSLAADLSKLGSRLILRTGASAEVLASLVKETGASRIHWNRLYEPASIARDSQIKLSLREQGLQVHSHNAALMFEPWEISKGNNEPYKIFTPYWKAIQGKGLDRNLLPAPGQLPPVPSDLQSEPLDSLQLLPRIAWDGGFKAMWKPGESGALERLETFCGSALKHYSENRDRPDLDGTSCLAPYLHFGEISPGQIFTASKEGWTQSQTGAVAYVRELAWREFAHHLLYHFPHTTDHPLNPSFAEFPWNSDSSDYLQAWQQGQTGIPLVDAGMRQLWNTGWMHNRVRMVVASFLVKNLRVHWLEGARWFWDTLVDADLPNNTLGWQWVAGCGADAAPYFRVFNPVLQGEKFDPEGHYIRRWVPELGKLPKAYIHQPWLAPSPLLQSCGVQLGTNYPHPIVDLKASRDAALAAYQQIRKPA